MSSGLEIHPVKDVRRQRIAISGIFLMVGIMLGTWFAPPLLLAALWAQVTAERSPAAASADARARQGLGRP